jgi:hypothetical protein
MKPIKSVLSKFIVMIFILILSLKYTSEAQSKTPYVRIVNIVIDSSQLESFKVALKKDIEASVFTEPGTIAIHAVFDKVNPTHVTVF